MLRHRLLLLIALAANGLADCPQISKWSAEGTANDSVGTNNGTLMADPSIAGAGVTYAPGRIGQAFSFTNGGYVSFPGSASLNSVVSFTFQAWIQPTSLANNPVVMSKVYNGSVYERFGLQVDNAGRLCGYINNSTCSAYSASVVSPNTWTYVAMSYDSTTSTLKLYANGAMVAASPASAPTPNNAPLNLGIDFIVPSTFYQGLMDEVQFYGCARADADIANSYSGNSGGGTGPPQTSNCTTTVNVPGTSNPWLAGMPPGSTDAGYDSVPAESPVPVTAIAISGGSSYTFSATGGTFFGPNSGLDGPDGNAGIGAHNAGATNGIATFAGPWNSLLGVFLDSSQPSLTPAPAAFPYLPDATTVSPGLKQVFFIGNGKTTGGVTQSFVAPAGATRLFLGTLDGFGWYNNVGSFTVQVNGSCLTNGQCTTSTSSGLVGYWPEDGNPNDVIGANNPSATSLLSFTAGEINQGASVGSGGYIDIPDYGDLDNQQFTIALWAQPLGPGPNNDTYGSVMIAKDLSPPSGDVTVSTAQWWSGLDNRFRTSVGNVNNTVQSIQSTDVYPAGQFYHVVTTYNGTTLNLYVNGQLEASTPASSTLPYDTSVPWTIGSTAPYYRSVGFPRTFNGVIDDVRVYNRALSSNEILGLYNDCNTTTSAVPVITGGLPAAGGILGPGVPGMPGQVSTTITGTGHPGCTIQLTVSDSLRPTDANNNRVLTTQVTQAGTWSIPITLDDCDPVIDVVQICNGTPSAHVKRQFNVDGTPPAFANGGPVDGTTYGVSSGGSGGGALSTIVLDGTAQDASSGYCASCAVVNYAWYMIGGNGAVTALGGGGSLGTLLGGGGQLSIGLAPGQYDFEVIVTDAAGNQLIKRCHRTVLAPLSVVTGLPGSNGILGPGDGVTFGQVTRTIGGTGTPGATVNITLTGAAGTIAYPVQVDLSGNWSIPLTVKDGAWTMQIQEVYNGVPGPAVQQQIYVDGTPPAFVSGGPASGLVYATAGAGGGTASVAVNGAATDASSAYCSACGALTYSWYQVGSGGALTPLGGGGAGGTLSNGGAGLNLPLTPGEYDLEVVVTDAAGNKLLRTFHESVRAPLVITSGLPGDGGIFGPGDGINIGTVSSRVTGTGAIGCSVNVTVKDLRRPNDTNNNHTYTTTVGPNGAWALPLTLDDCDPVVQVQQICNNVPSAAITQHIYVDGTPPVIGGMADGSSYVVPGGGGAGPIVIAAGASDAGSLVPNDALGYEWDLLPAAGGTGNPVVLCSGASCGDTFQVAEPAGAYDIQVVVTDRAGNKAVKKCHRIVLPRPTQTVYTGVLLLANGGPGTLSAVVTDITPPVPTPAPPVVGRPVLLTLGIGATAQSCTGTLQNDGTVQCQIAAVNQPLGPGAVLQAAFAGDATYLPSADKKTALVFAWAGTGNFVIGDQSSATGSSVTFWGAQWAKDNSLSGGSAPNAFKGYQDLSPNPPACGGTWTTDPGNSSGPPSSVPSYMGLIVSSSIQQSGSTISGNIPKIVIVQTNSGYGPDPGHAGSGAVVAVLCGK